MDQNVKLNMKIEDFHSRRALLIGNSFGGDGLERLPLMSSDLLNVRQGLEALGFESENILELANQRNADLQRHLLEEHFASQRAAA